MTTSGPNKKYSLKRELVIRYLQKELDLILLKTADPEKIPFSEYEIGRASGLKTALVFLCDDEEVEKALNEIQP